MVERYGYSSVEPGGCQYLTLNPESAKNLDLIRPVVGWCWTEHSQTAATLTQQSFSTETEPTQEKKNLAHQKSARWPEPPLQPRMETTARKLQMGLDICCLRTHSESRSLHSWTHAGISTGFSFFRDAISCYHCNWRTRWSFPARQDRNCDDSLFLTSAAVRRWPDRSLSHNHPPSLNKSLLLKPLGPAATSKEQRSSSPFSGP